MALQPLPRKRLSAAALNGGTPGLPSPSNRFTPFKEIGTSGYAVFGGHVQSREKDFRVAGPQRWVTYSDLVANTSIVAAGVRYFLNIVASSTWSMTPASDKADDQEVADFIESVINSMETPWRRVARRTALYRFHGFNVQEWTAKKRDDGKIGLEDIEARPQHTIERWEVDEKGTVQGVWQRSPQTQRDIYLPRGKIFYLTEDSLTDSPEGLGLYRHLIEPYERLKKYLTLEGRGFERDLRGIPIGRVPYRAIQQWVAAGQMSSSDANRIIAAIEDFVKIQSRAEDTSIVLDSSPYVIQTESGPTPTGTPHYGIELLNGNAPDFGGLSHAIERLNQEMARIIGAEHLLLGGAGSANRALAEDKSRNFYQTVNGTLDDIVDGANKDIINTVCDLNGIPEEKRPKLTHSDVSWRSVGEITSALRDMATAGATLAPDDPAIDDVRELLGLQKPPEPTPERLALLSGMLGLGQNPNAEPADETDAETGDPEEDKKPSKRPNPFEGKDGKNPFDKPPPKKGRKPLPMVQKAFDPNQLRDKAGKWARQGGGAAVKWAKSASVRNTINKIVTNKKAQAVTGAAISAALGMANFSDPIADEFISENIKNISTTAGVKKAEAKKVLQEVAKALRDAHAKSKLRKAEDEDEDDFILKRLEELLAALERYVADDDED